LVIVTGSSSGSISLDAATTAAASSCATAPASAIRSSGYPRSPIARQNRTTLVADVPQERASSEMLRQATPAGSSRTACATRRSTGARSGSSERIVTRTPTSGAVPPGSGLGVLRRRRPGVRAAGSASVVILPTPGRLIVSALASVPFPPAGVNGDGSAAA
jgi:hypothetical protein